MISRILIALIFLILAFISCTNSSQTKIQNKTLTMESYPFEIFEDGGQITIMAPIENEDLFTKYYGLFEEHGYSGNGESWAGIIEQIVEKEAPELLPHIDFDPEAGAFYCHVDSKQSQQEFVKLLSPIFSNLSLLEKYLISADRDRIFD
jgi:hypothetical protein